MVRRNNSSDGGDDDLVWKVLTVIGWPILLVGVGIIIQAVFGFLPSRNGSGAVSIPTNVVSRLNALEQSDKEQDVAIRRLRYDLSTHLRSHGVRIDGSGRPVGSPD